MFYRLLGGITIVLILCSCGGRNKLSPAELEHKLDSVKALEVKERLAAQGINIEETSNNPLKLFYDSLNIQALPISYTEDYMNYLPDYKPVPKEVVSYMNFEGREPKAITLPETLGAKLILLAADERDKQYSLWLYSLDDEYLPVDKLCLYAIDDIISISADRYIQYFSITSDYEIHLMDYNSKTKKAKLEEIYTIDAARKFVLQKSVEFSPSTIF